nr:dihydrofolate reductase family protein [Motilibacter peucedani]
MSMSASVDGFVNDREGGFAWTEPDDELFALHTELVGSLGGYLLGRRLYEAMLPWEDDPAMRADAAMDRFADIWCALPKVVFSRTLDRVQGNARLARAPLAEEAAALGAGGKDVQTGGATLAAAAFELGLVDELQVFRCPVIAGGGTRHLPPLQQPVRLRLVESRTFPSQVVYERYQRE